MKEKKSFLMRKIYKKRIDSMSNEEAWILFKAIFELQVNGIMLENLTPKTEWLLEIMNDERQEDDTEYKKRIEANSLWWQHHTGNQYTQWDWKRKSQTTSTKNDSGSVGSVGTNGSDMIWYDNIWLDIDDIKEKEVEEKETKEEKKKYLENVLMTEFEYNKLLNDYNKNDIDDYMNRLNNYIGQHWDKYKSHYLTLLTWMRKDRVKKKVIKPNLSSDTWIWLIQIKR